MRGCVAAAIATALRAGLGLAQALEQVVRHQPRPSAQEFALALREHRLGTPLEQALSDLARRVRSADYDMLVATLGIARELGGGLAEALDRLAVAVRRRVAMEDRIAALTAQGRLQGLIMAILPVLLGLVLYAMQPQAMQPLFETPLGWATLAVVAALEIGGWMLIRRIVAIRV
jgi:tight adherence protein B